MGSIENPLAEFRFSINAGIEPCRKTQHIFKIT